MSRGRSDEQHVISKETIHASPPLELVQVVQIKSVFECIFIWWHTSELVGISPAGAMLAYSIVALCCEALILTCRSVELACCPGRIVMDHVSILDPPSKQTQIMNVKLRPRTPT